RDRDPVQRTSDAPARALGVARRSVVERVRVDGERGVDALVVHRDSRQILRDELARCDAMLLHRTLYVGDARFDDAELRGPRVTTLPPSRLRRFGEPRRRSRGILASVGGIG